MLSCKCGTNNSRTPEDIARVIRLAGDNGKELELVLGHYSSVGDSLKLRAAYFLIRNMEEQFHFEGPGVDQFDLIAKKIDSLATIKQGYFKKVIDSSTAVDPVFDTLSPLRTYQRKVLDSLQKATGYKFDNVHRVKDITTIHSEILIDDIDYAFKAWQLPWCRKRSFDQFCEFILPYKIFNEQPTLWRKEVFTQFSDLIIKMRNEPDLKKACLLLNRDLKKRFYLEGSHFKYGLDLSFKELDLLKMGKCSDANHYAAYVMRGMGVPVANDFTPNWANKNKGHDWLVLLNGLRNQSFVGCESDPGLDKIYFAGHRYMERRCSKIFRHLYAPVPSNPIFDSDEDETPAFVSERDHQDVTDQYIPVSTINIPVLNPKSTVAYLCVFNNNKWNALAASKVANGTARFSGVGRDIAYNVMEYQDETLQPISEVFILNKNGAVHFLNVKPGKHQTVILFRKYPEDDSNKIKIKGSYKLFYYNKGWISLGRQEATTDSLIFTNVPSDVLLVLRNLKEGSQERIFTIENNKQKWW
ncbi:hypothetical protein [Mucilaginibacter sp.]|uniref:hypothetical protein n=1 Tax=Mucilaginibacter sp. TaxID=1882438 RepID=UPI0032678B11